MISEENHFERGKLLGEGAFGKVFLCHDKKEQDKKVNYYQHDTHKKKVK